MLLHVSILRQSSGGTYCSLLKLHVKIVNMSLYISVMWQHIMCLCMCCFQCREVCRLYIESTYSLHTFTKTLTVDCMQSLHTVYRQCLCKAIRITFCYCVSEALVIQHAERMYFVIICGMSCSVIFSTLSDKRHEFRKRFIPCL